MPERVKPPLVVDVDGTLVRGDLLVEGAVRLLAVRPLDALALPFRAVGGRAALKRRVAGAVPLPPETLALNPAVVDEIAAARSAGREVWLASAADELAVAPLAEAVGATGFFASDGRTNLAGDAKAAVLVERFGEGGFDYIGNERRDLSVWKHARRAIGVGLSSRLARAVRRLDKDALLLPGPRLRSLDCLRALRPHQWVKNVLAFAPLIAAHRTDTGSWATATGLFLALSACASSAYLFNDLVDLPHDRGHRSKRRRPMAAGTAPLLPMAGIGAGLAAGGLAVAFLLSTEAGLCVLLYLVATLAYSLWLKRKLFIDIVALAGLYELRVIAGSVAVSVSLSAWFLAFFMFVFLALAAVKRQSELRALGGSPPPPPPPPPARRRARLDRRRPPGAHRARRIQQFRVGGRSRPLHSESGNQRTLCTAGVAVADLSAAGLLAGTDGAARQPRLGGRRSRSVRDHGPHELAGRAGGPCHARCGAVTLPARWGSTRDAQRLPRRVRFIRSATQYLRVGPASVTPLVSV